MLTEYVVTRYYRAPEVVLTASKYTYARSSVGFFSRTVENRWLVAWKRDYIYKYYIYKYIYIYYDYTVEWIVHHIYPDLMGLFQDFCMIHYGHPNKQSSVEGDTAQCLFLCQVPQAVDMWSTGCILGEMLTRRWGRWLRQLMK